MPKNTGRGSRAAASRAAVFLYGSATPEEAANYWYDRAMESAKELSRISQELQTIREHWVVRMIERYKA